MSERSQPDPMIQTDSIYHVGMQSQTQTNTDELLSELIRAYSQEILNLAYSYVRDKGIAEDLTQEVFLKVYRNFDRFNGRSTYKTWIYSIAANCCRDYLRAQKVRRFFWQKKSQEPLQTNESAEAEALREVESDSIWNVVMSLPVKYREVVILHYKEDLSLAQISEILGVSEQTLRTRLFRARAALRTLLDQEGLLWITGNKN